MTAAGRFGWTLLVSMVLWLPSLRQTLANKLAVPDAMLRFSFALIAANIAMGVIDWVLTTYHQANALRVTGMAPLGSVADRTDSALRGSPFGSPGDGPPPAHGKLACIGVGSKVTCVRGGARHRAERPQARRARHTILHMFNNPIRAEDLDEDLVMFVGPDQAGNRFEIGVVVFDEGAVVVHGMPARPEYRR